MKRTKVMAAVLTAACLAVFAPAANIGTLGFSVNTLAYGPDDFLMGDDGTLHLYGEFAPEQLKALSSWTSITSIRAEKGTVLPKDCSYLFAGFKNCTHIDLSLADASQVEDMSYMFYNCESLSRIDLGDFSSGSVKKMSFMLSGCKSLVFVDFEDMNTSNVTDMSRIFESCETLRTLDLTTFKTSNVTTMQGMFFNCKGLGTLDVSSFDTSKVTDMSYMFFGCNNLCDVDLSGFITPQLTEATHMFYGCNALRKLDISGFNTSKVTNMSHMFGQCKDMKTLDLKNFNTAKVTDMSWMFAECENLTDIDVSSFDTSNVKKMDYMFFSCNSLKTLDLSSFDRSKVTSDSSMLYVCNYLTYLTVGSKFGNIEQSAGLPNDVDGWVNAKNKNVKVSGDEAYAEIANSGANTYIRAKLYLEGSGTDTDPYIIRSYSQLMWAFSEFDKLGNKIYFRLGKDITGDNNSFNQICKEGDAEYYLDFAGHAINIEAQKVLSVDCAVFYITSGRLTMYDSRKGGGIFDNYIPTDGTIIKMIDFKPKDGRTQLVLNGGIYSCKSTKGTHVLIDAEAVNGGKPYFAIIGGEYSSAVNDTIAINIMNCDTHIKSGDFYGTKILYIDNDAPVTIYTCDVIYGEIRRLAGLSDTLYMSNSFLDPATIEVDGVKIDPKTTNDLIGDVITVRCYEYTLPGDVNSDLSVDEIDAALVMKYINGLTEFTAAQKENADIYKDGLINILDAIEIMKSADE